MEVRQASAIPAVPEGMKVVLPAGRLLVIPEEQSKTVGGVVVSGQKDQQIGTVIQVGPRLPWQEDYPIGCKIRFRSTNSLLFTEKEITFVSVHHEDIGVGIVYEKETDEKKSSPCQNHDRASNAEEEKVQCPDCGGIGFCLARIRPVDCAYPA